MNETCILVLILIALGTAVYFAFFNKKREGYRDPIYLNRAKYLYDYYPRSNGSIYGEQANIFSGHPYYPKAY
jgi:hypothetical protein